MDKAEILQESGLLYDQNCKGCKKWQEAANQKHLKKAQEYCETQCEIGKRLLELGDYITYGRPTKTARDLIKEVYEAEREQGLTDGEIKEKYKISTYSLWQRKKFWGLIKKITATTKEQYLEMKDQGLPDYFIAQKLNMHISTLKKNKREWGIKHSASDMNAIKEGPNGEEISFETYSYYKLEGWKDYMILDHWDIGKMTLMRKKRAWKNSGFDIGKHSKGG